MRLNSRFDAQLDELRVELMSMAAHDVEALKAIDTALRTGDVVSAGVVPGLATEIDRHERDLEALCLRILLQRHPVASDLRKVSAALKMITDLQRIGHQAADMAEILTTETKLPKERLPELAKTAQRVMDMLDAAIGAYANGDTNAARRVMDADDDVDADFAALRTRLADDIRKPGASDPGELLNVLMLGKYLERMADHIVILARWVIFSVTGERTFPGMAEEEHPLDYEPENRRISSAPARGKYGKIAWK